MHTAAALHPLRRLVQAAVVSLAVVGAAVGLSGCCCNPLGFLGVTQAQSGPTSGAVSAQVHPGASTLAATRAY